MRNAFKIFLDLACKVGAVHLSADKEKKASMSIERVAKDAVIESNFGRDSLAK